MTLAPPPGGGAIVAIRDAAPGAPKPARRRRFGFWSGALAALLLVFSVRACINETHIPDRIVSPLLATDTPGQFDVIVVLGAGVIGACEPNDHAVRRTMLAVRLFREGRAPQMVFTGGRPRGYQCAIGDIMADLARELGVPGDRIRVEAKSRSTHENAAFVAPLLRELGARRLLIVTDRLHMRRATGSFEHEGFVTGRAAVPVYLGHADNVSMLFAGVREFFAYRFYVHKGWIAPGDGPNIKTPVVAASMGPVSVAMPDPPDPPQNAGAQAQGPAAAPAARPAAGSAVTVVILGASYAEGWKPAIPGVRVVNKGMTGQQSFELRDRFDRDVVAERPRAVVVWGFINDVFRAPRPKVAEALQRTRASYEAMVASARAHGIEPILVTEVTMGPRLEWSEWFASWIGWALGKTSYQQFINGHVLETNRWLREYATRERLLLLDFQPVVSDATTNMRRKAYSKVDGSHISPAGYDALTAYAAPILGPHLTR